MQNIDHAIEFIFQTFKKAENDDYIGEPISQLAHALQCAYFAEQAGHHDDVILACLLHDIGHIATQSQQQYKMADLGVIYHEWIGAKLIYDYGFSQKVALLVGHHVDAKRYLSAKKTNYYDKLSHASKQTLMHQGGLMTLQEIELFEHLPYFKEILQVRINDEKAKQIGLKTPRLDYYLSKIKFHLKKNHNHPQDNCLLTDFVNPSWITQFKNNLLSKTL